MGIKKSIKGWSPRQVDAEVRRMCALMLKTEGLIKIAYQENPDRLNRLLDEIEIVRAALIKQHNLQSYFRNPELISVQVNLYNRIIAKTGGNGVYEEKMRD